MDSSIVINESMNGSQNKIENRQDNKHQLISHGEAKQALQLCHECKSEWQTEKSQHE